MTLQSGMVIHVYCGGCKPPKDKFFVVGTLEPTPLLLLINSQMNRYVQERAHLQQCHVKLSAVNYSFLHHDSWIACCDAYSDITHADLERELTYGHKTICGVLSAQDTLEVASAIHSSPVMLRKHKQLLLKEFNS